jgi:hypothetical protein
MKDFIQSNSEKIEGVLQSFDRIIIKGYLKLFYHGNNFYYFLSQENVKLKDYKSYVLKVTDQIKKHVQEIITKTDCYSEYLNTTKIKKEKVVKEILSKTPEKEGLVCVLSCVEPCSAITIKYNTASQKLEKSVEYRKCLHYYFYYNDRELGLMYVRLQTWLPFMIQIYINGKEYLKKQLAKANIPFTSDDNCITSVSDFAKAQRIADRFIEKKWVKVFDHFARQVNVFLPRIEDIFNNHGYMWYIQECEYASDVIFKDRETLKSVYPYFVEYASLCQMGENIFTFFGRKAHLLCQGEAVSDRKHYWQQGFRVKFTLDKNSIKMYDRGNVLRIETTINNASAFKIRNPNPQGTKKWVPMGKNISNMYRYVEIARKCNERYLDSLAVVNRDDELDNAIERLCHPQITKLSSKSVKERSYSAFNPLKDLNCKLFNVVMNAAYTIRGFTTRHITKVLIELKAFSKEQITNMDKLIAKVGRLIAQLRAHKLVTKLPNTFRYRVTSYGQKVISRILLFKKHDLKFC